MLVIQADCYMFKQTSLCQLPTYADYEALPALAAAPPAFYRPCSNQSTSPTRRAHSSKPAAAAGEWDRRPDTGPFYRPSPRVMRTVPIIE